jgi:hypothetical protein
MQSQAKIEAGGSRHAGLQAMALWSSTMERGLPKRVCPTLIVLHRSTRRVKHHTALAMRRPSKRDRLHNGGFGFADRSSDPRSMEIPYGREGTQ